MPFATHLVFPALPAHSFAMSRLTDSRFNFAAGLSQQAIERAATSSGRKSICRTVLEISVAEVLSQKVGESKGARSDTSRKAAAHSAAQPATRSHKGIPKLDLANSQARSPLTVQPPFPQPSQPYTSWLRYNTPRVELIKS